MLPFMIAFTAVRLSGKKIHIAQFNTAFDRFQFQSAEIVFIFMPFFFRQALVMLPCLMIDTAAMGSGSLFEPKEQAFLPPNGVLPVSR